MAIINSVSTAELNQATTPFPDGTVIVREGTFSWTAALTATDTIELVPVYAGEKVVDIIFYTDDMDDGSAVFDIGDDDTEDRFIDGSTVGQAGGMDRMDEVATEAEAILQYTPYAADNTIDVTMKAIGTGIATGTMKLRAFITR